MPHVQDILVDRVGVFELVVEDDLKYVLSSLSLTFQANAVPSANMTLLITDSISIADPLEQDMEEDDRYANNDAMDLFHDILDARNNESKLLLCDIYESIDDGEESHRQCVFSGRITNAEVINSSSRGNRMLQLTAMYETVLLQAAPLTASTLVSPLSLRKAVADAMSGQVNNEDIRSILESAFTSADKAYYQEDFSLEQEIGNLKIEPDWDLAERIGAILDMLLRRAVKTEVGQKPAMSFDIDPFFRCKYALSDDLAGVLSKTSTQYNAEFNEQVGRLLQNGIVSGSILGAIDSITQSSDFMLMYSPSFPTGELANSDDAFYGMYIEPVDSWNTDELEPFVIDEYAITSMECTYTINSCINNPNVFACVFGSSNQYMPGDKASFDPSVIGIYTRDAALKAYLTRNVSQATAAAFTDDQHFKLKTVIAPEWADKALGLYSEELMHDSVDRMIAALRASGNEVTPEQETVMKAQFNSARDPSVLQSAANLFAQAVYATHFGAQDTFSLEVNPALRFGYDSGVCFEDSIGRLFRICINDDFDLIGRLVGVAFNMSSNGRSSVTYSLAFDTIRNYEEGAEPIHNPLYMEVDS